MEHPRVSIVVVSYNHAHYIKENLDSIKAQTYPNIQLIVCDDASKDNSVTVFKQWLSENNYPAIKNFHTKNTGLATTLNECFDWVQGKYVKFMAADDYFHPRYIEDCVRYCEIQAVDMVFTQAHEIDHNDQWIKENYFNIPENPLDNILEKLAYGNFIPGSTLIYKTQIIKTIGKYRKNILLEDYDFILRALFNGFKIGYLNQNLIYYRRHENNITHIKNDSYIKLFAETEILKLIYFRNKKYVKIINKNLYLNIRNHEKKLVKLILKDYLLYPYKSIHILKLMLYKLIN